MEAAEAQRLVVREVPAPPGHRLASHQELRDAARVCQGVEGQGAARLPRQQQPRAPGVAPGPHLHGPGASVRDFEEATCDGEQLEERTVKHLSGKGRGHWEVAEANAARCCWSGVQRRSGLCLGAKAGWCRPETASSCSSKAACPPKAAGGRGWCRPKSTCCSSKATCTPEASSGGGPEAPSCWGGTKATGRSGRSPKAPGCWGAETFSRCGGPKTPGCEGGANASGRWGSAKKNSCGGGPKAPSRGGGAESTCRLIWCRRREGKSTRVVLAASNGELLFEREGQRNNSPLRRILHQNRHQLEEKKWQAS